MSKSEEPLHTIQTKIRTKASLSLCIHQFLRFCSYISLSSHLIFLFQVLSKVTKWHLPLQTFNLYCCNVKSFAASCTCHFKEPFLACT